MDFSFVFCWQKKKNTSDVGGGIASVSSQSGRAGGRPAGLYYLVTSHEAQVAEGLAALRDLSGPLVRDVLTPAGVHRLDGAAVLADGYQGCGTQENKGRGVKSGNLCEHGGGGCSSSSTGSSSCSGSVADKSAAGCSRAGDVSGCDRSFRC